MMLALNVTVPPAHTGPLPDILIVGTTLGVTTIVILLEVAETGKAHDALLVSTTLTTSLLAKVVEVNVAALLPALFPFTFHWYAGVAPPFVGVAVKVIEVPAQILLPLVTIETEGVTLPFTIIIIAFEVAVGTLGQAALLVNSQVTISPPASDALLKLAVLEPVLLPFTFHW